MEQGFMEEVRHKQVQPRFNQLSRACSSANLNNAIDALPTLVPRRFDILTQVIFGMRTQCSRIFITPDGSITHGAGVAAPRPRLDQTLTHFICFRLFLIHVATSSIISSSC